MSSSTNESESLFGSRRLDTPSPAAPSRIDGLDPETPAPVAGQTAATVADSAPPDSGLAEQTATPTVADGTPPVAPAADGRTAQPKPTSTTATEDEGTAAKAKRADNGHRHDVDVMRVLAGLTVMVGHSGGVLIGRSDEGNAGWWLGHFAEAVNPWAVPMFFMIAGWAVLAGAPPRTEAKMWDRIIRHTIPLAAWSVIFVLGFNLFETDEVDVRHELVRSLLEAGRPAFHLWYLYAYIPLILVFGTLVLFWKGLRPWKLSILALVLAGSMVWVPFVLELVGSDQDAWKWGFATYQVVYFIVGAFVIQYAHELRPPIWSLILLFAASAAGVLWWESQREYPIANANPLIVGLAISVILIISRIRLGERTKKIFTRLASASFGAFLVHVFFRELFFEHLYDVEASPVMLVVQYVGFLALMATISYTLSLTWGKLHLRRLLG
jgi:surface polysaccharide O-acyltransferase-like enzyme